MSESTPFEAAHGSRKARRLLGMVGAGVVFFYARVSNQTGMREVPAHWLVGRLDMHKAFGRDGLDGKSLFAAEEIEVRNLVNAGDGAQGRTRLLRNVFALDIGYAVFFQWLGREAALL